MKQPIRILVVDTDLSTVDLCNALNAQGLMACVHLSNSAGAMARFTDAPPDLAVVEIVMPETDGIELLIAMKQHRPATKVIAISGGGTCLPRDTVLYWARRLGADAVLPKPFGAAELEQALQAAFSGETQPGPAQD